MALPKNERSVERNGVIEKEGHEATYGTGTSPLSRMEN